MLLGCMIVFRFVASVRADEVRVSLIMVHLSTNTQYAPDELTLGALLLKIWEGVQCALHGNHAFLHAAEQLIGFVTMALASRAVCFA